jgi:hypothetical protein
MKKASLCYSSGHHRNAETVMESIVQGALPATSKTVRNFNGEQSKDRDEPVAAFRARIMSAPRQEAHPCRPPDPYDVFGFTSGTLSFRVALTRRTHAMDLLRG